ncbi:MAG: FAD-binding oxidoreductase [Balneolaceae bacterium]|nr:FAD-binding oxidoreductase [Balneolaceae bacterium]
MSHTVTIKNARPVTHDVRQFDFEKPEGYEFTPGQATMVSINKEGWKDEKRPFTFTSLNEDPYLQFTIKIYEEHDGVTEQIGQLEEGDQFLIGNPWGAIQYKGPGVFLAGGAGVTPFIAILRKLHTDDKINGNRLIFSNKTEKDIILEEEFREMLGDDFINVITRQETDEYLNGYIDKAFLEKHIDDYNQPFYICGTPDFVDDMKQYLKELGADPGGLVFEE